MMDDRLRDDIERAARVLADGGVVAYPTETVYGIGCDPLDRDACDRIVRIKERDGAKTMLLAAASVEQVEAFGGPLDERARVLADAFWPGPLTLVVRAEKADIPHLRGPGGGVAFRVTPHPVASELCRIFGGPVTSTSANLSGEPPVRDSKEARVVFGHLVDLVIAADLPSEGIPSTVLDLTTPEPVILRRGAVDAAAIQEVLKS